MSVNKAFINFFGLMLLGLAGGLCAMEKNEKIALEYGKVKEAPQDIEKKFWDILVGATCDKQPDGVQMGQWINDLGKLLKDYPQLTISRNLGKGSAAIKYATYSCHLPIARMVLDAYVHWKWATKPNEKKWMNRYVRSEGKRADRDNVSAWPLTRNLAAFVAKKVAASESGCTQGAAAELDLFVQANKDGSFSCALYRVSTGGKEKQELVGNISCRVANYRTKFKQLVIKDLFVEGKDRGKGFGTLLLAVVVKVASKLGCGGVCLELPKEPGALGKKLPRFAFYNNLKQLGFFCHFPQRFENWFLYFDEQGGILKSWELSKSAFYNEQLAEQTEQTKVMFWELSKSAFYNEQLPETTNNQCSKGTLVIPSKWLKKAEESKKNALENNGK
ncbi:MAG: GNAT family N-acetyltransferase [Candidatus Dependentiae bacterium]|nr:GNAT family N-acetyltransferase [Candidatus Dependentiae bacterium]